MPTFRELGTNDLNEIMDMNILNDQLVKADSLMLVKQHPNIQHCTVGEYSNIIFLHSSVDVYLILPFTDKMITDYSSVMFDYILLGKPIILFAYDKEEYFSGERGFYFDYDSLDSMVIVETFEKLLEKLDSHDMPIHSKLIVNFWNNYDGNHVKKLVTIQH